jgi:hypothetical protein
VAKKRTTERTSSKRVATRPATASTTKRATTRTTKSVAKTRRTPSRVGGAEIAPEVIVDFVFERGVLHVAVANIGDVPAHGVVVKFDRRFTGLGGACDVRALRLFRGIEFLAPRKRIETLLDTSVAYFARGEPTRLVATITYRDARGRTHERRIAHDLRIYEDIAYVTSESTAPVAVRTSARERAPLSGDDEHGRATRATLLRLQLPGGPRQR